MTLRIVAKLDPEKTRAEFPLASAYAGWFFRARETSNEAWLVEGTDLWGRRVSRRASDPDRGLALCVEDAKAIDRQVHQDDN